ncbi:hypothetical protein [Natronobeatus ordinarius]|uniref:hypothetical protein n=1 Tax=Natronobeatus ordinarius TaxID=2963433 RepID=UPI0020CC3091|nr:hypothetical protein [Natronobeatus ordinarius]
MTERVTDSTSVRIRYWYGRLSDPRVGFLILAPAPVVLFGFAILGTIAPGRSTIATVGAVASTATLGYALRAEWGWSVLGAGPQFSEPLEDLKTVLSVVLGAVATLAVTAELGVSSIVAAGIVGAVGVVVLADYDVPIYCGAFVGMTSPELFTTYAQAYLAGLLAGLTFVVVRPVFEGFGGKLGTTAFVAAVPVVAFTAAEFHSDPLPEPTTNVLAVGYSIAGAAITYAISVRLGRGPVLASSVVGIVGGLALPAFHPAVGELLAAAVFCASFVGMVSPDRLPGEIRVGLAGAVAGLVFVYTTPYLGGSGGKLGTIAFGACLSVWGLERLWLKLTEPQPTHDSAPRRASSDSGRN